MSVSMSWGVSALARMRGALRVPHVGARRLHITPVTESKNRGRARKSPKTLLRLYAEGKLKGSEAVKAAALLEAQNAEQAGTCLLYTSPSPRDGLLARMPSSA